MKTNKTKLILEFKEQINKTNEQIEDYNYNMFEFMKLVQKVVGLEYSIFEEELDIISKTNYEAYILNLKEAYNDLISLKEKLDIKLDNINNDFNLILQFKFNIKHLKTISKNFKVKNAFTVHSLANYLQDKFSNYKNGNYNPHNDDFNYYVNKDYFLPEKEEIVKWSIDRLYQEFGLAEKDYRKNYVRWGIIKENNLEVENLK